MKPSSDFSGYQHDIGKPHFSAQNPWWPHRIRTTLLEYLYTNICPCPKSPSFDSFVGLVIYQHHFVRIWDVPAGNSLVSEPKKRNTLHNVNCQMAACEEMLFQWLGKLSGPWAQVHIHALCIFCFLFLRQLLIVKIDRVSVKASKMPRSSSRNMSIWSARPAYQWRKLVDKIGKRDLCCLAILTRTLQDRVQESFRWLRLTHNCEVGIMVLVRGFLHGPLLGSKKADPKRWPFSSTSSLPIMFGAKLRFEVPCSFGADGTADFLETRDLSWYSLYGKLVLGELLQFCKFLSRNFGAGQVSDFTHHNRYASMPYARLCMVLHVCICQLSRNVLNPIHTYDTSSTAQGGGGSFKNRKPKGKVGCCESRKAERSHWWIERWWLMSPLFLFLSLTIYLPTYLCIYLSTYVSIYLSTYLPIYLSICLSICLSI